MVASSGIFVCARQGDARGQIAAHMGAISHGGGEPEAIGKAFAQTEQAVVFRRHQRGRTDASVHHDDLQALRIFKEIVESQMALAFGRAQIACGQQPAEPAIGGAVLGIGENVGRPVGKDQPRARDDAHRADRPCVLARENMGAHDAGERIAIGDADSRKPKLRRLGDQFFGMRSAAQKRKIRRRREFGKARLGADHGDTVTRTIPCTEPLPRASCVRASRCP